MRRTWTRSAASHVARNRGGAGASSPGSGPRGRSMRSPPSSSWTTRSRIRSATGTSDIRSTPAHLAASASVPGPKAARYRRNRRSSPSSSATCTGPSHSAARRNRSARRCSQVPAGGSRTSSTQAPGRIAEPFSRSSASSSLRRHSVPRARAGAGRHRVDVDAPVLAAVRADPPLLPRRADPGSEVPVVPWRDDVDGRAHERPLHCTPPLERTREIAEREALEHRPEADVRRRGVLGLQTGDPLERAPDRDPGAGEKELAGEDGPVQRPRREDHGRTAALR